MTTTPVVAAAAPPHLRVWVAGTPAPQGNKRPLRNKHTGKIALVESATVGTWRDDVRAAVRDAHVSCLDGPVWQELTFVFARPKSHYRTGRNAHLLRTAAPRYPQGRVGDAEKLARAVNDALESAGVFRDDAQVVDQIVHKRYAERGAIPGALIVVRPLA